MGAMPCRGCAPDLFSFPFLSLVVQTKAADSRDPSLARRPAKDSETRPFPWPRPRKIGVAAASKPPEESGNDNELSKIKTNDLPHSRLAEH